MKNDYEIDGEITRIFIKDSKDIIHETLIDTEDLELVKWLEGSWKAQENKSTGDLYVTGYLYDRNVFLHRLVTNSLNAFNKEVDHIYHDTLDNRKSQLRLVTKGENQQNRRIAKNNISGVTGVFYNPESKRWTARIGINGKKKHLGSFENKEDAIQARREGEKKHHTYKQSLLK